MGGANLRRACMVRYVKRLVELANLVMNEALRKVNHQSTPPHEETTTENEECRMMRDDEKEIVVLIP